MIKAPKTDTEFRIAFAQSWNLAVEMVSQNIGKVIEPGNTKQELETWQKYFYKKLATDLVEKEANDALNQLNYDRSNTVANREMDYINDLSED